MNENLNIKMRVIQRRNESIDRYNKLKDEKKKVSINIKKPTTDKLIAIYLFIILNVILVYSMISMWNFADLSCLGVLITDIAGQVITYYIYAKKPQLRIPKVALHTTWRCWSMDYQT